MDENERHRVAAWISQEIRWQHRPQKEIASTAGVSQSVISRLLSGSTTLPTEETLERLAGALGTSTERILQLLDREEIAEDIATLTKQGDGFFEKVRRIAQHREPTGSKVEIRQFSGIHYLNVERVESGFVESFAIGFCHHPSDGALTQFLRVHAEYQRDDPRVISQFIYRGYPPSTEVAELAWHSRVRLRSFREFEGLMDFTPYLATQSRILADDRRYPSELYVAQRGVFSLGRQEEIVTDLLAKVSEWLCDDLPRFILILGNFGTGKTFLLRQLARGLTTSNGPIPLYIPLRTLEKAKHWRELLSTHLAQRGMERIYLDALNYDREHGRIALLFDGYDELALRVTYARAADHFEALLEAGLGSAKVVVTSRSEHFFDQNQLLTALGRGVTESARSASKPA